jgi:hypothetical protein
LRQHIIKGEEETAKMITSKASKRRTIVIAVHEWPSKAQTPAREGHQYPVRTPSVRITQRYWNRVEYHVIGDNAGSADQE